MGGYEAMGQNQYGKWDDKKVAAVERRYARRRAALSDRFTKRLNKLEEKREQVQREEREQESALLDKMRSEIAALMIAHDEID